MLARKSTKAAATQRGSEIKKTAATTKTARALTEAEASAAAKLATGIDQAVAARFLAYESLSVPGFDPQALGDALLTVVLEDIDARLTAVNAHIDRIAAP
jgi:uncharacterized membrane protein